MLRKGSDVIGLSLQARDGSIGEIRSFYFDDEQWVLRYFLVETSPWFSSRDVLVAPECFTDIDWSSNSIPVNLTREQIRTSPSADYNQPVSREAEEEIVRHYGWQQYWNVRTLERRPMAGTEAGLRTAVAEQPETHLRNMREVTGYTIRALDGEIGQVKDYIVDTACWQVRYLVIDTGTWGPGKEVLLSPEWVDRVNWEEADVSVGLLKDTIKESPAYDPSKPVTRDYEDALCDYYHLPKYWRRR